MRLATFNMRAGGSRGHWDAFLALDPDVALIQETRNPTEFAPGLFGGPDLCGALWRAVEHGKWGSSLYVPRGTVAEIAVPGFRGWVSGGLVASAGVEVFAFSVHLPPTKSSYIRSANRFLDELAPVLRGAPVILGGDWNLTISRGPGGRPFKSGEADLHERLATEFGLKSAWNCAHEGEALPQTLRWANNRSLVFHCDGILVPSAWPSCVQSVDVIREGPWLSLSDHNPVVARLRIPRARAAQEDRLPPNSR